MRNITVTVTDDTYRHARIWAAHNNTTVSSAVNYMLENVHRILRVHKPPRHVDHKAAATTPTRNRVAAGEAVEALIDRIHGVACDAGRHGGTVPVAR